METEFITVGKKNTITVDFSPLYDAGLESDKYFDILKNKKGTTLLIIPFGTKYDKNKFDLALQTNRALFEPLTFNGDVFDTKAGDQLKLEIGDFGIFVTKENK